MIGVGGIVLVSVMNKGQGGQMYFGLEDSQVQTYVVLSVDALSRYVFRSDVAYDWVMTVEDLKYDTVVYTEDHLKPMGNNVLLHKDWV
ncbi:hypothetical protein [Bacillus sp. 03113]|uniref:hypothetical protein n=1 Tax=Bacillus sp. 03113 TaxID=2578211 RepID=UPI0011448EA7|nr:hypothetical protein [Bacillus sp. 03113]